MGDCETSQKEVRSGGPGHIGHIVEQFHDKVQTPMVALCIAVLTSAGINVPEPLKELIVHCKNRLQVEIMHVVNPGSGNV